MTDPNDLQDNDNADRHQAAPLNDAGSAAILARLIEMEYAVNANTAKVNAQSEKDKTERDLLNHVEVGERWMIVVTILIFLVSAFQAFESWSNNQSTGKQVERIIDATNRIDDAADSFSTSSSNINRGISDAVAKLDAQIVASRDYATLTRQQFVKDQRPYIWHDTLQEEQSDPSLIGIRVYYTNYGKSPALRFSSTGHMFCSEHALAEAYRYLDKTRRERKWDDKNTVEPPGINQGLPTPNRGYDTFVTDRLSPQQRLLCQGPNPALPRIAVGAWEYYDLSGNRYYGEFCNGIHLGMKRGYDASGNCDEHNVLK